MSWAECRRRCVAVTWGPMDWFGHSDSPWARPPGSAFILKRAKKQSSNAASQAGRLAISYLLFIVAGMGLMLLLQFLFWPGRGVMMNQPAPSTARASEPSARVKNPPWGQIEYVPIA